MKTPAEVMADPASANVVRSVERQARDLAIRAIIMGGGLVMSAPTNVRRDEPAPSTLPTPSSYLLSIAVGLGNPFAGALVESVCSATERPGGRLDGAVKVSGFLNVDDLPDAKPRPPGAPPEPVGPQTSAMRDAKQDAATLTDALLIVDEIARRFDGGASEAACLFREQLRITRAVLAAARDVATDHGNGRHGA